MAMTSKREIKKIEEQITGKVRGVTFITDFNYIKRKKGKKGVEKVQKQITDWGVDLDFTRVSNNNWYPAGWRIISLLAIKKVFNWGDKEIFEMGRAAPKNSFVVKTLLRYFVSMKKTFQETVKYWKKHWTVGELKAEKLDLKNKRIKIRVNDFQAHPVLCQFLKGYFQAILELIVKDSEPVIEEKKCMSRGDKYHEFQITW